MKNNKHLLTALILLLTSASSLYAQDANFTSMNVFKPELANPAYRFENKIIDANILYSLPNTAYNKESIGEIGLNVHSQFRSDMGVGIKGGYANTSLDGRTSTLDGASFNYNLKLNEDMDIAFGIGGGVIMDIYDASNPAFADVDDTINGYAELGVAYRWTNLFVGASVMYPVGKTVEGRKMDIFATMNVRYDFNVGCDIKISPLVNYLFINNNIAAEGELNVNGIISGGAIVGWSKWVEVGVTYDTRNVTNAFASVWASDFARVFYNGSISSNPANMKNEIGVRIMFNKK